MRIPRLTIEMLEGVVALVRNKTFDHAGRELGISGSALHKRIHKLNRLFGFEIFEDTGHGMKLRDEAQALNEFGLRIIEYTLLAEHRTVAWISRDAQAIQIGHSTHIPPKLLAMINRIAADSSLGLRIENRGDLTANLKEQVIDGSLEVGIGFLPVVHPDLMVHLLVEDPVVVCMPPMHRLASKALIEPYDLADEPILAIGRNPFPALHEEVEGFFQGFGIQLKVKHDAFGPPEALIMVEQNEGICIVGSSAVGNHKVVAKPLSPRVLVRRTGMFLRQDNSHPDTLRFVERVLETIRRHQIRT